jgi:glycosyltransferase involved in cell wall biosynthesis
MRICLYTETALPKMGGQEFVVDALARQFLVLGHEVVVLAPRPRPPLQPNDAALPYPVVRHPRFISSRHLVSWYRWWLLKLHRTRRFDVLHCHGIYPPGYLAGLSRRRLSIPTIITSHGGDVREGNVRLAKTLVHRRCVEALQQADALIAISRFTREGLLRLCPRPRRLVSIPNGVDSEPFAESAPRPSGIDAAIRPGQYVLFLGRLKQRKGADVLLNALKEVPARESVQLVIAGDGEERQALERQTTLGGLGNRVHFVGPIFGSEKVYLLQNALCTVVPSRLPDAFPLVVLESYAAGTPVLGTRVPGLEDLIQADRTGWLVAPDSPRELSEVLKRIFSNPARARRLGEEARGIVPDYSWQTIALRHVHLYQTLRKGNILRLSA